MNSLFLVSVLFVQDSKEVLIDQLGHACYQKREMAHRKLDKEINFNFYLALRKRSCTSLEQKRRIESLLENYLCRLIQRYRIDLKGYPAYPWISSLPDSYVWEGLGRHQLVNRYVPDRDLISIDSDWSHYRLGTQIWMRERIDCAAAESIEFFKNENDFHNSMKRCMEDIQRDIELMIRIEDAYWIVYNKTSNPLRRKK